MKKSKLGYNYIQFCTYSYEQLNFVYEAFYKNKHKKITCLDFLNMYFTDVSLAILFMDDGSNTGNASGFHLNTNCFSKEDLFLFINFLKQKYGLEVSLHSRNRLYVKAKSSKYFAHIVKPYLHESMFYKLGKYA